MSILRNVVIAISLISFITFVALFGQLPVLRKTPIGWLQRILCIHIPKKLQTADHALTGGQLSANGRRLGNYLFYKKNPIVLILFLFLLTGSAILFLYNTIHLLPASLKRPIPFLLTAPYIFTYLCVAHTSHYVTQQTHDKRLQDYPYDHILYRPGVECKTCHFEKPARSKHCSLCKACVAKCDHHCPWVNACLGRGNYRWFLALLLSLSILEYYASYLAWWLLRSELHFTSKASFSLAYMDEVFGVLSKAVASGGLSIAGVGMLTISTAGLPLGLLAYHLYLIWAGMTTNESQKWSDWREDMMDGYAFEASRSEIKKHIEKSQHAASGVRQGYLGLRTDDENEHHVRWPKASDQILVQTTDGQPPNGQGHLWHRVWHLDHVDNIYDLGFNSNMLEVIRGK